MASSAELRDILQCFDEDASFVGRAQEAEDLLQKLGMQFRGLQGRMLLEFCLNRRDAIAVMPTAGGKSFFVTFAGLLGSSSGTAGSIIVVIAPLKAQVAEQVSKANALFRSAGSTATAVDLSGDNRPEHSDELNKLLLRANIRLVYTTPEMLRWQPLRRALVQRSMRGRLEGIVVEDAHVAAVWGHSFRDAYGELKLDEFQRGKQRVPVLALAATATHQLVQDLTDGLQMAAPQLIMALIDHGQHNLQYEFEHCLPDGRLSRVHAWVKQRGLQSSRGLVFVATRKAAEQAAAAALRQLGYKAADYHSGMTAADKASVMSDWQAGVIDQVVTTSSLAVGVDVCDVRFVVHLGLPPTLTDYVQDIGRGGRGEKPAQCFALYDLTDSLSWAAQSHLQPYAERNILEMQAFAAQPSGCRSVYLQKLFDVSADAAASAAPAAAVSQDAITCCDVCSGSVATTDGSVPPHRDAALRDALMTLAGTDIDSRAMWPALSAAAQPAAWRELSQRDKDSTALSMLRSGILSLDYAPQLSGIVDVYLAPGPYYDG